MAPRERKSEDKVARNRVREMSIGENYEKNITPIRSDISRFSRGTDSCVRAFRSPAFTRSTMRPAFQPWPDAIFAPTSTSNFDNQVRGFLG